MEDALRVESGFDRLIWLAVGAVLGAVFGLFIHDPIVRRRDRRESARQREISAADELQRVNRDALTEFIPYVERAFGMVDQVLDGLLAGRDLYESKVWRVAKPLKEAEEVWRTQIAPRVNDQAVHQALMAEDLRGWIRQWEALDLEQASINEFQDVAVGIHNALVGVKSSLAPYLPGLSST
jgi:hypothetical protein